MTRIYAFVGSRTTRERNARGEGISVYAYDAATGALDRVHVAGGLVNPSYLALNRRGDRLYTVHGDGMSVSVLAVESDGALRLQQQRECGGRNPVYLALDPSERHLVVSDHLGEGGGTLIVLPLRDDGWLDAPSQRVGLPGHPGPHRDEQPHAKPHANPFSPDGRHVIVPDKGLDRVFSFHFEAGRLQPASSPWVATREGAGPRHLAFHPAAPYAYVVNELDSSVTAYRYEAASGGLRPMQVLSTLPDTYTANSRGAGIAVSPDGRMLYASNRGHDSIAVFRIDTDTGRLRFVQAVPSQGAKPRHFTLSPDGAWLYALNEDSDCIATFAIDRASGELRPHGPAIACGSPVCMVFAPA